MKFYQSNNSTLLVPTTKPKQPPRNLHPSEITEPEKRELAKQALSLLWDAMDLTRGNTFRTADSDRREFHRLAYRHIGEMLLGPDCPEKEQLC